MDQQKIRDKDQNDAASDKKDVMSNHNERVVLPRNHDDDSRWLYSSPFHPRYGLKHDE